MTVKELIAELQALPEDAQDKRVVYYAEGIDCDINLVEVLPEWVLI